MEVMGDDDEDDEQKSKELYSKWEIKTIYFAIGKYTYIYLNIYYI